MINCNVFISTVYFVLTINHKLVLSVLRQSQAVTFFRHGGEVAETDEFAAGCRRAADECEDVFHRVVDVDPFKTRGFAISLPKRALRSIQLIQIANQSLHTAMQRLLQQMPIQTLPLGPLA